MTTEPTKVTADAVQGLAEKLESLEMNEVEAQLLDVVFARAEAGDADVQGFGVVYEIETTDFKNSDGILQAGPMGAKLGRALGFHIHVNPYIGDTEKN